MASRHGEKRAQRNAEQSHPAGIHAGPLPNPRKRVANRLGPNRKVISVQNRRRVRPLGARAIEVVRSVKRDAELPQGRGEPVRPEADIATRTVEENNGRKGSCVGRLDRVDADPLLSAPELRHPKLDAGPTARAKPPQRERDGTIVRVIAPPNPAPPNPAPPTPAAPNSAAPTPGLATRLLLLDTSAPDASLALAEAARGAPPRIVASDAFPGRQASELLLLRLAALLQRAGWSSPEADRRGPETSDALHAIAVVTGPGSFTGVRIGLAAAKGLAEAWQVPIIGISRLLLLATTAEAQAVSTQRSPVWAALSAGRGELFLRKPSADSRNDPPEDTRGQEDLVSVAEARRRLADATVAVCETSVADLLDGLRVLSVSPPTASDALPLALERSHQGRFDDTATIEGNYLRRTDLEMLRRSAEQKKR